MNVSKLNFKAIEEAKEFQLHKWRIQALHAIQRIERQLQGGSVEKWKETAVYALERYTSNLELIEARLDEIKQEKAFYKRFFHAAQLVLQKDLIDKIELTCKV